MHEKGLVHRDMKPGNILSINEGDDVVWKIADFGATVKKDIPAV